MDDNVADVLRLAAASLGAGSRPRTVAAPDTASNRIHKDAWAPGVTLNDYTDREPSEDGTYVKVITHKERVELIEQPPTPEELEQRKEDQKQALKLAAVLAGGAVATVVVLGAADIIKAKVRGS